jgi:aspartate/methionine/tyrosine aminotransferase
VCPTASNSIDLVGAWARTTKTKVGLIEPTFDNLALLLKRREVEVQSISEHLFHTEGFDELEQLIVHTGINALFITNPNNPTGRLVKEGQLRRLTDLCKKHKLTMIFDTCFRFCQKVNVDEYKIMKEEKIPFIILEDTGKIWPTLDSKASLLSYSADIAPLMRPLYEEVYLCSSNFTLALLCTFMNRIESLGGLKFFQKMLIERHICAREQIQYLPFKILNDHVDTIMSVIWLDIRAIGKTDLELINLLTQFSVSILPGRYFYWNSHHTNGHYHVRISLLKPKQTFLNSLVSLKTALDETSLQVRAL